MDELFDYLKNAKTNRRYLVTALIGSELVGIFTLIWVLKTPLYQKFLQNPPKAYSTTQMQPQTQYVLAQNDYLQGKTNNSGKVIVLLSGPESIEEKGKIRALETGDWYYQISDSITPGIKSLTVAELDETNNILSMKNYKIRITPNDRFNFKTPSSNYQVKIASIEDILPQINLNEQSLTVPNLEINLNPPQD